MNSEKEVLERVANMDGQLKSFFETFRQAQQAWRDGRIVRELSPSALSEVFDKIFTLAGNLPPDAYLPKLVTCGDRLYSAKAYHLANILCYARFIKLFPTWTPQACCNIKSLVPADRLHLDANTLRLSYMARAELGAAMCHFHALMKDDPLLKYSKTVAGMVETLDNIRTISETMMKANKDDLYWLIFNCSVSIYEVAAPMLRNGFGGKAVGHVLFAALSLEAVLSLSATRYLLWRVRLYNMVCSCYEALGTEGLPHAEKFAKYALAEVRDLKNLEESDVAPMPDETVLALNNAIDDLSARLFRYEVSQNPAGAEAGLNEKFENQRMKQIQALVMPLVDNGKRRVFADEEPGDAWVGNVFELLDKVSSEPIKALDACVRGVEKAQKRSIKAGTMNPAYSCRFHDVLWRMKLQTAATSAPDSVASTLASTLATTKGTVPANIDNPEFRASKVTLTAEMIDGMAGEYGLEEKDVAKVKALNEAQRDLPVDLHISLFKMAYSYRQWAFVEKLLTSLRLRLLMAGAIIDPSVTPQAYQTETSPGVLGAEAMIVMAAFEIVRSTDAEVPPAPGREPRPVASDIDAYLSLATVLHECTRSHYRGVYKDRRNTVADAALLGWKFWEPRMMVVEGVVREGGSMPEYFGTMLTCIDAIDVSLMEISHDDILLKAKICLMLSFLLEDAQEYSHAIRVLRRGLESVHQYRDGAARHKSLHFDIPGLMSISTDYSDAKVMEREDAEKVTVEVDGAINCLHVDIYNNLFRNELKLGVILNQQATLEGHKSRPYEKAVLSRKDKKMEKLTRQPPELPHFCHKTESRLLQECGRNQYIKGLLYVHMAHFRQKKAEVAEVLEKAAQCFEMASQREATLLEAARKPANTMVTPNPVAPRIMSITDRSLVVKCDDFHPKRRGKRRVPQSYMVYCKPAGSGIAVSTNNNEYAGTGELTPLDKLVTVEGLDPNTTYVAAVTVHDETGAAIGAIGVTSNECVTQFPLPLLLCWAHLGQTAYQVGNIKITRKATTVLHDYFIHSGEQKPLWVENPLTFQTLRMDKLLASPYPVLRAFVHSLYLHVQVLTDSAEGQPHGDAELNVRDPDLKITPLPSQIFTLKNCKKLMVGLSVAISISDYELIMETVLRIYNLIKPLLKRNDRPVFVLPALQLCQIALQNVPIKILRNLPTMHRIEAAVNYELVQVYNDIGETSVSCEVATLRPDENEVRQPAEEEEEEEGSKSKDVEESLAFDEFLLSLPDPKFHNISIDRASVRGDDVVAEVWKLIRGGGDAAFKELMTKHKDNPRFLEFVCKLMQYALKTGNDESITEWYKEAKDIVNAKNRYLSLDELESGGGDKKGKDKKKDDKKKDDKKKKGKGAEEEPAEDAPSEEQENAATKIQTLAPKYLKRAEDWKNKRSMTAAELPWRSEMEALVGLTAYVALLEDKPFVAEDEQLSEELFVYKEPEPEVDEEAEAAKDDKKGKDKDKKKDDKKKDDKKKKGKGAEEEEPAGPVFAQDPFIACCKYFARSCVLATRGQCWVQAQNAARLMVNSCRQKMAQPREKDPIPEPVAKSATPESENAGTPEPDDEGPKTLPFPGGIPAEAKWPIRAATECILVMLETLKAGGPLSYESTVAKLPDNGMMNKDLGGDDAASVKPSEGSTVAKPDPWFRFVKDLDIDGVNASFDFCIRTMYYNENWAFVEECISRYNAATENHYIENTIDLLIQSRKFQAKDVKDETELKAALDRDKNISLTKLGKARQMCEYLTSLILKDRAKNTGDDPTAARVQALTERASEATNLSRDQLNPVPEVKKVKLLLEEDDDRKFEVTYMGSLLPPQEPPDRSVRKQIVQLYSQAIDYVRIRREHLLLGMGLNEMGDFLYSQHEHGDAGITWADAADGLFNYQYLLKDWRGFLAQFPNPVEKYGFWNTLLVVQLMGKLARYIYTNDNHWRLEASLFGAELTKILFSSSLPHAMAWHEFASYRPRSLWTGVDIFQDPYICRGPVLVDALEAQAETLIRAGFPLESLPLLCFYEYVGHNLCLDGFSSVNARLMKSNALIDAGYMTEAAENLRQIMLGERLPVTEVIKSTFRRRNMEQISFSRFYNNLTPEDSSHADIIAFVTEHELDEKVISVYGPYICNELTITRARFLSRLACVENIKAIAPPLADGEFEPCSEVAGVVEAGGKDKGKGKEKGKDKKAAKGGKAPAGGETSEYGTYVTDKYLEASEGILGDMISKVMTPEKLEALPAIGGGGAAGGGGKDAKGKDAKGGKDAKKGGKDAKKGEAAPTDEVRKPYRTFLEIYTACKCMMLLADIEERRHRYTRALEFVRQAMLYVNKEIPETMGAERQLVKRTRLGMDFWLSCRVVLIRLLFSQGHNDSCLEQCARASDEMAAVNERIMYREIRLIGAQVNIRKGEDEAALASYDNVIESFAESQYLDYRFARGHVARGELLMQMGRVEDAHAAFATATDLFFGHVERYGLVLGCQDHMINVHLPSIEELVSAKICTAHALSACDSVEEAVAQCDGARALLEHLAHPMPQLESELELVDARARRKATFASLGKRVDDWGSAYMLSNGYEPPAEVAEGEEGEMETTVKEWSHVTMDEASFESLVDRLLRSVEYAMKFGENNLETVRAALMELAMLYGSALVLGKEKEHANTSAAYVQLSYQAMAAARAIDDGVYEIGQAALAPADLPSLPEFATLDIEESSEYNVAHRITGPERHEKAVAPKPPAAWNTKYLPVLLYYNALLRDRAARLSNCVAVTKKLTRLHFFLRTSMADYQASCCLAAIPNKELALETMPQLVCVQWYMTDGINPRSSDEFANAFVRRQRKSAAVEEESLTVGTVTLPTPESTVAMVVLLGAPEVKEDAPEEEVAQCNNETALGGRTLLMQFPIDKVRSLHKMVKDMCSAVEARPDPTDEEKEAMQEKFFHMARSLKYAMLDQEVPEIVEEEPPPPPVEEEEAAPAPDAKGGKGKDKKKDDKKKGKDAPVADEKPKHPDHLNIVQLRSLERMMNPRNGLGEINVELNAWLRKFL